MFISQSETGSFVVGFFLQNFSQEPAGGNVVLFDDADEILLKTSGASCVNIY